MLQDAGLDAVALADAAGRVVWQGVYSPYGEVLRSEGLISAEDSRIGHHGLFFDRFGAAAGEATLAPGAGGLGAGAGTGGGVYHARHRGYTPGTGRFLQGDPNATGLALVTDPMWHSGMAPPSMGPGGGFDAPRHYGDGMNAYEYLASTPVDRQDPLGTDILSGLGDIGVRTYVAAAASTGVVVAGGLFAQLQEQIEMYTGSQYIAATAAEEAMRGAYHTSERLFLLALFVKGDKSQASYDEHAAGVQGGEAELEELGEKLADSVGKGARDAIKRAIEKLKHSIKGHKKEMQQKWPKGRPPI